MARALPADLPEVTDAHRLAAFQAMHWTGWTFEAAMGNDTRRRLIEARAHQLRTQQWRAERRNRGARYTPHVGTPSKPRPPTVHDLKRAAAGDMDD